MFSLTTLHLVHNTKKCTRIIYHTQVHMSTLETKYEKSIDCNNSPIVLLRIESIETNRIFFKLWALTKLLCTEYTLLCPIM